MKHEMKITGDAAIPTDAAPNKTKQKQRFPHVVKSDAGMFKNGKLYKQGDEIMLDEDTAATAKTAGDIE